MTLENAVRSSMKGYIDDPDDIEEILSGLIKITVDELSSPKCKPSLEILKYLMTDYGSTDEQLKNVTYAEMLCLIDGVLHSPYYPETDDAERQKLSAFFLAHYRFLLASAEKTNTAVQLFVSISVRGYFDYLVKRTDGSKSAAINRFRLFKHCVRYHMNFTLTETTTIKSLLEESTRYQQRPWNPCSPIKSFEQGIVDSYQDIYVFLIEHFKEAFPECFDLDKIRKKYSMKAKPDISWDNNDDIEEVG